MLIKKELKKRGKKVAKRRNNKLNGLANFVYTENQYFHIVPRRIKYKNMEQELRTEIINNSKSVKKEVFNGIEAGDNIKFTKTEKNQTGITINVRLSKQYKETDEHIDVDKTPISGENLDEVTKKLFKAIAENSDTIDGENIDLGGGSTTFIL